MTDSATRQYTARIAIVDPDQAIELGMTVDEAVRSIFRQFP